MFPRRVVAAVAGSSALVFGLSGCALVSSPGPEPLTGLAACAYGHEWQLNLDDLSQKVLEWLQAEQVPATEVVTTGTQSLDWGPTGRVTVTSDFEVRITAPVAADQTITIVQTHTGTATGAAYINGEVAIPRKWDDADVEVETVADNNGTVLETVPWTLPTVGIDDRVGLEITCDASTMTIHPRGNTIVQTWTR